MQSVVDPAVIIYSSRVTIARSRASLGEVLELTRTAMHRITRTQELIARTDQLLAAVADSWHSAVMDGKAPQPERTLPPGQKAQMKARSEKATAAF